MRTKAFTRTDILDRATWPESQAALRGPTSYDELGIPSPRQRRRLGHLAQVEAGQEKAFLDEVVCCINGYRLRKRRHAQERPAAVAESMLHLIKIVYDARRKAMGHPAYAMLKPPLPTDDWFEHAMKLYHRKKSLANGHRPPMGSPDLSYHAFALQRIAVRYSADYLAADQEAMQRWLAEALIVSGERPVGKNTRTAYFEQLMLKQ